MHARRQALAAAVLALCATARAHAGTEGVDAGGAADPGAPTVGASLDRTEAHVGDPLTLTVSAVAHGPIVETVRLPEKLALGRFELLDTTTADQELGDGRKGRRFVLQIAAYEVGELELPAIPLEYRGAGGATRSLSTAPIPVRIKAIVDDPKADLQPLRPPRDVMVEDRRPAQALAWSAALLGAGVAAYLIARILKGRRRRIESEVVVAARPAHEVALERLRGIRERGGFGVERYRPFHFEVAEVVRAYLGARYEFDSLELTTTELIDELRRVAEPPRRSPAPIAPLPSPVPSESTEGAASAAAGPAPEPVAPGPDARLVGEMAAIADFLETCDLVKFAKAPSSDAGAEGLLKAAERIVEATRPEEPVPAAGVAHG